MKMRFTEEQIFGFLREAEPDPSIKEFHRQHGFSKPTGAAKSAVRTSGMRRVKELETENARLKKLLAESILENEITREALRKSSESQLHHMIACGLVD
jgi:putative transposase